MLPNLSKKIHYFILAFVVPLVVRSVPEVIAWPYPIGFDTLIYMDRILGGSYLGLNLADLFGGASFFYAVCTVMGNLLGDAVLTVKVLGPVLSGLLCGSLYLYSRKVLGWTPLKAFAVSLLAGTYFVSLRISWEMYRQMLGLIFLVVGLMGLRIPSLRWRIVVVASSGFLVVWSHQLAAVLFFIIVATHILVERGGGLRSRLILALMAVPAFSLFFYQMYSPVLGSIRVPCENIVSPSPIYATGFISGFLAYMFLPLLPLIVLGVFSFRNVDMLSSLIACLVFTFWPVFFPRHTVSTWLRWAILMVYPAVFLSVEGASRLWSLGRKLFWKIRFGSLLVMAVLSLNLVMSGYYLTSMPEHPIKYFGEWNGYKQFIQTSMLQNSVSISDTPSVIEAIKWLGENAEINSVLVLHEAMDNWARILVNGVEIIRVNEFSRSSLTRENVANRLIQLAEEKAIAGREVYTVWWVDGKGWYSMPMLPLHFVEIQRFGDIGVFQYFPKPQT